MQNFFKEYWFLIFIILVGGGWNYYSDKLEKERAWSEHLEEQVSTLTEENEALKEKLENMEVQVDTIRSNADELKDNVERLEYENWQDVMPDISTTADDLETNVSDLEAEVN